MKNKYILGGVVAAMMSSTLVSCSDSYLDEAPLTQITAEAIKSSETGAVAAAMGLLRQMQHQYTDLKNGNLNISGETYLCSVYGEGLGPDANPSETTYYMTSGIKPANFRRPTGWWSTWMYRYCYSIIGSANIILDDIKEGTTDNTELWLKGTALTMRAHCYAHLMQVYAPRWVDSNNGEKYCIIFRLHAGEENEHPFNTCNEVYDQLYSDLEEAIRCFEASNKKRDSKKELFMVDENVARGIFARLALLKNDYKTAQKMAHDARQKFPIMEPNDYLNGFSTVTSETMWSPVMDYLDVWYWNWGAHYACNGHYSSVKWGYTFAMDYQLYKHFKASDVRSRLYFGPLTVEHAPDIAQKYKVTASDFFDKDLYSQQRALVSITGSGTKPKGKNLAMWNFIKAYGLTFADLRPEDNKGIYVLNKYGLALGTQFKFQGLNDGYSSCWIPYMRGAEMLLIEAEAACQNHDDATALACLKELMAKRDPNYSFTGSGAALLAEVKLQRRLELWGEGFNWFDFKRWGETIEYRTFNENFDEMGCYPKTLSATYAPDYMNGWRATIPQVEFTYNKEADPSLVGQ